MNSIPVRIDRRTAIKWMLTAAAATAASTGAARLRASPAAPVAAEGYGTDPNLVRDYKPGDLWPLTFSEAQRLTAATLCAVILPAQAPHPSAADLGVHDFIDEWISAPYPNQRDDRPVILQGLEWIEAEAQKRFGRSFPNLVRAERHAICDDICSVEKAAPEFSAPAIFFARFRDLTAGGYYTTPEGMKDIGYTGNLPQATFDGPAPDVLKRLGLV
jgi:hypothetical protein